MTAGSRAGRGRVLRSGLPGVLLAGALVLTAATAWGWWSNQGSGHGSGTTRSAAAALVLTPATPSSAVLPGTTAAVASTVTNPASADVRLRSLALDTTRGTGGFVVDAGHAACPTGSLSFAAQDNGGAGWTVPGGGTLGLDLPGALTMAVDAADACQGASFTVYLRAAP